MKIIVVLLIGLFLVTSPAFGALTAEDLQAVERLLQPIINELSQVKRELRELKADVMALQREVGELKGEVRGQGARITDQGAQMRAQTNALLVVAGLLVMVLLWMLKQQWDARREDQEKNAALQAEVAQLQAENERLRPRIVTERGNPATGNAP